MSRWSLLTWNVNSIRVRLEQLVDLLERHAPDVAVLQETKTADDRFPRQALEQAGWHVTTWGQPTYNGVALLSRRPAEDVRRGFGDEDGEQARLLAATVDGIRVVDVYVPNGSEVGSDKYAYKLAWLERLCRLLADERDAGLPLVVAGDFNVAPDERDIWDPVGFAEKVLFSPPERAALGRLLDLGLEDVFRRLVDEGGHYSWWDYRGGAFRRGHGARIDLVLADASLAARATGCTIDVAARRLPRPSDHAPVIAEFAP
ncbi:MAG: exodeoxyribonuclease III [Acidobacteriota bacterium]